MQSLSRKLKRIAEGKRRDRKTHNNRKRTPGRNVSYAIAKKVDIELPKEKKVSKRKKLMLTTQQILKDIHSSLSSPERMKKIEILREEDGVDNISKKRSRYGKRKRVSTTVDTTIKLMKDLYRKKLSYRTIPLQYGMGM